jgi:hypothetical protein
MLDQGEQSATVQTLYEVLSVAAPTGMTHGETIHTAEKETVDRDRESDLAALLLDRS